MFDNNVKDETIARMISNARKYGELRFENLERSTAAKLSTMFCTLIVGAIILIIGGIVAVLLSIAAVIALTPHVGGTIQACLFIAFLYTIVLLVIYLFRHQLFRVPLKRAFDSLILGEKSTLPPPTLAEVERTRQSILHDYNSLRESNAPRNKRERIFVMAKKCWNFAEAALVGYKLYKRFRK